LESDAEEDIDDDDDFSDSNQLPDASEVAPVAEALIRVVHGNPNLTHLALGKDHGNIDWTPHFKGCVQGVRSAQTYAHTGR
jgi:hypothetical protein